VAGAQASASTRVGSETAPAGAAADRTLRVATVGDVVSLNPYQASDVRSWNVLDRIYRNATIVDWERGGIQPWLAVEWCWESKSSPGACSTGLADDDYMNVSAGYKLGDWASRWGGEPRFHDLTKVTLDDVVFSYGMMVYSGRWVSMVNSLLWKASEGYNWFNPPYGDSSLLKVTIPGAGEQGWLGVKISGPHSLSFRMKQVTSYFAEEVLPVRVFPKAVWQSHINIQTGGGDYLSWNMGYNPSTGTATGLVGTGPFKFSWWKTGQPARLLRFDPHFDWTKLPRVENGRRVVPEAPAFSPTWAAHHLPDADALEFHPHGSFDAALYALQNHTVDAIQPPLVGSGTAPRLADRITAGSCLDLANATVPCASIIRPLHAAERGFHYLAFNMRLPHLGYKSFPGDLTDTGFAFRRAVAQLTDRAALVSLQGGHAEEGTTAVGSNNLLWYNRTALRVPHDPAAANATLDAAGWLHDPGDPKCTEEGGAWRKLPTAGCGEVPLIGNNYSSDPVRAEAADRIANASRAAGLRIKAYFLPFSEVVNRITARNFSLYILGWRIGSDPQGYFRAFFHCAEQASGNNYEGYCSSRMDFLLDEADWSADLGVRVGNLKEAQGLVASDHPYVVLYHRSLTQGARSDRTDGWVSDLYGAMNEWSYLIVRMLVPPEKPKVLATSPAAAETGVALDRDVWVHFDTEMEPSSTAAAFSIAPQPAGGSVSVSARSLRFSHSAPFSPTTTYTVRIASSANSSAGMNLSADHVFSFTTGVAVAGAPAAWATMVAAAAMVWSVFPRLRKTGGRPTVVAALIALPVISVPPPARSPS
jgi:ABC-type transport system substrate-binding protein